MNIDLTKEELEVLQKLVNKLNPKTEQVSFKEAIKTNPIATLIGKSFPDQEGLFAARFNDEYYFVESSQHRIMKWKDAMNYFDNNKFFLPTEQDLLIMRCNKKIFNLNCPKNDKWRDLYWSSDSYVKISSDEEYARCVSFDTVSPSQNYDMNLQVEARGFYKIVYLSI